MRVAWWKRLVFDVLIACFLPVFLIAALLPKGRRELLVWGSTPLITNKYWAEAIAETGRPTMTIMAEVYAINRREDFDRYFADFAPGFLPGPLRVGLGACLAFLFVLRKAAVLHTSYWGFAFGLSTFWGIETFFLRLAGVKTVVASFGGDGYIYSRIVDTSLRYGVLASYPHIGRMERETTRAVEHWNRHADIVLVGLMIDGLGRWDVTTNQIFSIDTRAWSPKTEHSGHDGMSGPVRILHAPNHRGFKGSEFVIDAVERLKAEGLNVELVLLEKVQNEQVKALMQSVDILATGYGINGIEGMASGLPVLANLEHEAYTRVFRRFGFLDECPVLSTTPESLVDNLRLLIKDPELRRTLGRAGRAFAEKYHSYECIHYMFGAIYRRILDGEEVDLLNLFHPLKSAYNRATPRIEHPLVDSKLPPAA
jgi:glycosyltransferase involved in cell wall biosynthesis